MSNKVTIIGAGSVGSTIAYTMTVKGIASEIVLIDINHDKAEGEAMDIQQGTPFCCPVTIYSGTYEDAKDSDVVVISSGLPRKPGQTRLDLAQTNVNIMKEIAPEIAKHAPDALYIIVSNPVDIMTYAFMKYSGLPESKIIGSGTILDTARLRYYLSDHFGVCQKNIHAYVMGEHGDSSFIPWSLAKIAAIGIEDYCKGIKYTGKNIVTPPNYDEVIEYVRTSGGEIIKNKQATYYAVSVSVCSIVESLFTGKDYIMTVSSMMHGEYGLSDVCISHLFVLGIDGVKGCVTPTLLDSEIELMHKSGNVLKDLIAKLEF
ncbi:MAG: L-lactate dehydrogenase [Clostridia bacterium]|nr:L-lactate dehydrogenase [Clostridia bacterium]